MLLSSVELRAAWRQDRHTDRKRFLGLSIAALLIFLLCMCFRYNAYYYEDKFVPIQYAKSLWLAGKLLWGRLFHTEFYANREAAISAMDSILYYGALARLKLTLMAFVAGGALAVSGAIFQTAYQNPMASPNIIGASAGVGLGNVLVVMLYSAAAYENIFLRYKLCYGLTALCVAAVLLLGRLAGDRRNYSVVEMVMAGSVVSQMVRVVSMYLMYQLEDEELLLYEQLQLGAYIDTGFMSMVVFFGVMAAALLPVLLLRYRMNAIGMEKQEATALGVSTGGLRLVGQLAGAVMVTCAMIHCGEAGMIAMVIPYGVRCWAGSDFRRLVVYSLLLGGSLMMLCRLLSSFIMLANEALPVTFLINLFLVPVFLILLAKQGGSYETRAS